MWPYEDQAKSFAIDVLRQFDLRPDAARVGVVEFSSSASVLQSLSHDRAQIEADINRYSSGGGTHISDGLAVAHELLRGSSRVQPLRHVVRQEYTVIGPPSAFDSVTFQVALGAKLALPTAAIWISVTQASARHLQRSVVVPPLEVSVSAGAYPSEVSWSLQCSDGTLLSGGAPLRQVGRRSGGGRGSAR